MIRAIGKNQLHVLMCLWRHPRHEWFSGPMTGWTWNGYPQTLRLMRSLERRGWVFLDKDGYYRLTDNGRALAATRGVYLGELDSP